jgi:CubicO group peptidase (beta-lactamase class C family)
MNVHAEPPRDLAPILEPIRKEAKLPSMAAAVVTGDKITRSGVSGLRKRGEATAVTINDKYHIGSCTKMMTATLAAILIEQGKLNWDTTIGDVLLKQIPKMHADYRSGTIEQLLAHVGGPPTKAPTKAWAQAWKQQGSESPVHQRRAFVTALVQEKPSYTPGSATQYSNQGYAIAGHMLETVCRQSWETLMREYIFLPLQMTSAGFRAPCSPDVLDHPWGHTHLHAVAPEPKGDNPDAIGPAGTVHASIEDWAKFARFHLQRKPGTLIKHATTFERLHATLPKSGSHAVGGWLAHDINHLGGPCIQMTGSNTMWFALLWILPTYDTAIVVATNSGQAHAFTACDKVVVALIKGIDRD